MSKKTFIILSAFLCLGLKILKAQTGSGVLDQTFKTDTTTSANYGFTTTNVWTSLIQPDGKIIFGGDFSKYKGVPCYRIARLNTSGYLDTAFTNHGGFNAPNNTLNFPVRALALQDSGKILVGGNFTSYGTNSGVTRLARLYPDGSLDVAFTNALTSGGLNGTVYAIAVQSNGKIIVGGDFTFYQSSLNQVGHIIRLNSDGTMDNSFNNLGAGFNSATVGSTGKVYSIKIQADNSILVAGDFINYNGDPVNRIIRLNSDGSPDIAFRNNVNLFGGFNEAIYDVAVHPDGRIFVGGSFIYTLASPTPNHIACLNANGSLNTQFIPVDHGCHNQSGYATDPVSKILMQPDGKILLAGSFISFRDKDTTGYRPTSHLLRLNKDCTLDKSFNNNYSTASFSSTTGHKLYTIALQTDGKIIAGGNFTLYNTYTKNRALRLYNNIVLTDSLQNTSYCAGDSIHVSFHLRGTFTAGNNFILQLSDSLGRFIYPYTNIATVTGTTASTIHTVIPSSVTYGTHYRVRVASLLANTSGYNAGSDNEEDITIGNLTSVNPVILLAPNLIALTVDSSTVGMTYQWKRCNPDITLAGENNSYYTPSSLGEYKVLIYQGGCVDSSACFYTDPTSFNQLEDKKNDMLFISNPCHTCEVKGIFKTDDLEIINTLGQKIEASFSIYNSGCFIDLGNYYGLFFLQNKKTGTAFKFIRE